jgi:hypothetical protein
VGSPSTSPNHIGQSYRSRITGIRLWQFTDRLVGVGGDDRERREHCAIWPPEPFPQTGERYRLILAAFDKIPLSEGVFGYNTASPAECSTV